MGIGEGLARVGWLGAGAGRVLAVRRRARLRVGRPGLDEDQQHGLRGVFQRLVLAAQIGRGAEVPGEAEHGPVDDPGVGGGAAGPGGLGHPGQRRPPSVDLLGEVLHVGLVLGGLVDLAAGAHGEVDGEVGRQVGDIEPVLEGGSPVLVDRAPPIVALRERARQVGHRRQVLDDVEHAGVAAPTGPRVQVLGRHPVRVGTALGAEAGAEQGTLSGPEPVGQPGRAPRAGPERAGAAGHQRWSRRPVGAAAGAVVAGCRPPRPGAAIVPGSARANSRFGGARAGPGQVGPGQVGPGPGRSGAGRSGAGRSGAGRSGDRSVRGRSAHREDAARTQQVREAGGGLLGGRRGRVCRVGRFHVGLRSGAVPRGPGRRPGWWRRVAQRCSDRIV